MSILPGCVSPLNKSARRLQKGITVNELPEELRPIASGVHWDSKRDTFYVRASGLPPSDLNGQISRFQQALEAEPDNAGLLAGYLEHSGQGEQARAELQWVAQSGDALWADKARQLLGTKPEQPDA